MILNIIVIISIVLVIAFIINGIEDYHFIRRHSLSFADSIKTLKVPIVTFTNNNVKLHFLLDTGSDSSYIRKEVLSQLDIKKYNTESSIINTGGGAIQSEGEVVFDIYYRKANFENIFEISGIASFWDEATKSSGIVIHGILGSQFLSHYKHSIDFKDNKLYLSKNEKNKTKVKIRC